MPDTEPGTRSVETFAQWASALDDMYAHSPDAERIVWANMYQASDSLNINSYVAADFPEASYLTNSNFLPVVNVGQTAVKDWLLLPPVVCDMVRVSSEYRDKLSGHEPSGHKFINVGDRLGQHDFGWHIDGELGPSHVDHLTVSGLRVGKLVKITDRPRMKRFIAREVEPNQEELARVEEVALVAPTALTFSPYYHPKLGIFPDLHRFQSLQSGSASYLLGQHVLNDKALAIFERLVEEVPELAPYHPDEVNLRTARFIQ